MPERSSGLHKVVDGTADQHPSQSSRDLKREGDASDQGRQNHGESHQADDRVFEDFHQRHEADQYQGDCRE